MGRSGDRTSGRRWLTIAATATVAVALAACGSAAGSGKAASSTAKAGGINLTMWLVTTGPSPANQTIYSSVQSAPSFQYSWDQAVPPQEATPMLANLAQVFELTMTPQKFAATMDSQNSGA